MTDFQRLELARLSKEMAKKLADLPERLKAAQEKEHEDAELEGREPREVKIDPIVEIDVDLLDAVLQQATNLSGDAAEHARVYRLSVKRNRAVGVKKTNVLARQLAMVFAGVKLEVPSEVV